MEIFKNLKEKNYTEQELSDFEKSIKNYFELDFYYATISKYKDKMKAEGIEPDSKQMRGVIMELTLLLRDVEEGEHFPTMDKFWDAFDDHVDDILNRVRVKPF